MHRFNIYKKSKKFHWSNTLIIITALLSLYVISIIKQNFINPEKGIFEDVMMKLIFGLFILGFIIKTIGLKKIKAINEEFSGFLEFHND